jgi:UDP-N-acetylglucosamine acyltransferase
MAAPAPPIHPLVHPGAIVEDGADLHPSVRVGPFTLIESGAVIGEGCVIESNCRIYGRTRMGRHNRVCHGATIGAEPQDLGYAPERGTPLTIGDHNQFKEGVNISHGIKTPEGTRIGSHNYLMAFAHIGHDCVVGDHNVFANTATLGGHVELAHHIFLSGHVAVHQFCRIGPYCMVGGVTAVTQDVPPFVMADGHRAEIIGLNVVGLRRNGFDQAQRNAIKRAYRTLYKSGLSRTDAMARLRAGPPDEHVQAIIEFVEASRRGLVSHR